MHRFHACFLGCTLCMTSFTADGQTDPANERLMEEVVVVAHPLSGEGLAQASEVLQGEELVRKATTSIGGTLAYEPGIHNAAFGETAGRPVIHGLGGARVKVMEDRIDTLDVSVTSADHATSVEPFIADRIEVLKGPSTLLYGSGAIGGVVDVHTGRIPHQRQDGVSGGIETRHNENTSGNTRVVELNGGGPLAWHVDGTWKDGDDYEIPGETESRALRAAEEEEGEEEEEHEDTGRLPGSKFDTTSYAGGLSYIWDNGFIGASISEIRSEYGLPGGHGHEHEEEEEEEEEEHEEEGTPTLDLEQTRLDFEMGLKDPFAGIDSINVRIARNDYEHEEIEPNGEVATRFTNDALAVRGEVVHSNDNWKGAFGIELEDREFSAVGEEAFVPPVDRQSAGIFWVLERNVGDVQWEGGVRLEQVEYDPSSGRDRNFDAFAVSLGGLYDLNDTWTLSWVLDHSSRAPTLEELFSNGPHLVTNAFELGDPNLDNESATGFAVTLRATHERWSLSTTAYVTSFSDYIYEQNTGEEEDELPVFQFMQDDALFTGIDFEASMLLSQWDGGELNGSVMFDWVSAELDVSGNDNIPRIPATRFGAGLDLKQGNWSLGFDYVRVNDQDDTAPFELESDAYDDLRAYAALDIAMGEANMRFFVQGRNLTDDDQRLHTSFIKDVAPAPGRTFEAGVRLTF